MPDNTATTAAYSGRTTSVSNHNGVRSSRSVNSQGKVVSITDAEATADASSVSYQYDPWGNLTQTTDAAGNVTTMAYDLRGRKTQLIDPDMGTWNYSVDNLGQVTSQLDARLQTTSFTYDVLGRLTRRFEPDLDSRWYFETNALGVVCNKGIGKLCEATTTNGYFRRNTYDNLARLSSQTSHVDADYSAQWSYDPAGRLGTQTFPATVGAFPTPLGVKYNYTPLGLLQSVANTATGTPWWTRNAENADGNVTTETYGNGLIGSRSYDALMGRLVTLQAGPGGAPGAVQNQRYHYDNLGRLDQRQDDTVGVGTSETFSHDSLNRLVAANLTAPGTGTQTTSAAFNAIGNLVNKSGVGTYAYNASGPASVRPHAVGGVSGTVNGVVNPGYGYDANGNMLTDGARSFAWTSFNMPATLTKAAQAGSPGAGSATFLYGPEHQRVKQTWVDGAKTLTTVYLSEPLFEKEVNTQTGLTEFKHYVRVGSSIVAMHTRRSNATEEVRYLIPDHLGSTSVVTDAAGAVIDRQAFDPWGDRRVASGAAAGAADPTNLIQPTSTTRGFTGHEQLDQGSMGLTHMNGRVYDPTLGRFISADPNVQAPFSSQSFNRYSYLWNAPLSGADPSGFFAAVLPDVTVSGRCGCLTGENAIKFLEDWRGQEPAFLERAIKDIRSVQRGALIAAGVAQKTVRRALISTRHPLPQLLGAIVILMNPDEVKQPGGEKKAEDGLKADGADSEGGRIRGLPPEGVSPPTDSAVKPGPASRPSERDKGGQSLWDEKGGEWRYFPEDRDHNPHWDYTPHDKPSSPWQNEPIGQLPPRK